MPPPTKRLTPTLQAKPIFWIDHTLSEFKDGNIEGSDVLELATSLRALGLSAWADSLMRRYRQLKIDLANQPK